MAFCLGVVVGVLATVCVMALVACGDDSRRRSLGEDSP